MKTLVAMVLVLTSTSVFANEQIVIPQGTKVEKYKYNFIPNNDPISLAACGVYSKLGSETILNDMTFKYDSGPFYQYLSTNKDTVLTLESKSFSTLEGNDCEYKGFGYEDPDWDCTTDVKGHWMKVILTLKDSYGNTWTTWSQTELLNNRSDLPTEEQFGRTTVSEIQNRMGICQFQD
ncbi:MAG: hypothetical protein K0R29_1748 [Pseudobdellovibrio sp.]|jgi:hypothetical protein|nr:hypothetical protein [Pseudobdellovibrio sp.]